MEERSIPLNTFSYNAAISACAAGRALELAVDLFSTMHPSHHSFHARNGWNMME